MRISDLFSARFPGVVRKSYYKNGAFMHFSRYPVRRLAPFSATSSPMDKPGRFGYLHTSLCALSHSDVLSGVKIAISRDLQ